jgi:probable rRNA maturation factor
METVLQHIEASAEAEVPTRSWLAFSAAAELLASEVFPSSAVALLVCGDERIRSLNQLFRGVDAGTDVLSFPSDSRPGHSGDIAISWDAVGRQARLNGNAPVAEALALLAHGLLHLAGFEHDTDAGEARMNARTVELCRLAGYEVERFGH